MMTDEGPRLVSFRPQKDRDGLKRLAVVLGVIAAFGAAATTLIQWVRWPWELRDDATVVHTKQAEQIGELKESLFEIKARFEAMPAAVVDEIEKRQKRRR
jgi:hypothetical protein